MPSMNLSYVNIALDTLGLIVMLIVFSACMNEWLTHKSGSRHFLFLLGTVILSLMFDILSWVGEGNPSLSMMTLVANTAASCTGQLAMICFMEYLRYNLYRDSRAVAVILNIFRLFCYLSLAYCIGNAFFGYSFSVSPSGHYVHSENEMMVLCHLLFSISAFVALILMALFAPRSAKHSRISFIIYTSFPIAGIIMDYIHHGISLTYVSIVISVLVIYTDLYLQRQKMISAQKNALMLSQINPHFIYNTLSTIAAMCESSPKLAKSLTVDFSRYLRRNLESLSSEDLIPFEKELEHVECYLKIEKARFRNDLRVIYSIQSTDFSLPPLTVQPIVENAVKHGITRKAGGGTLKISTRKTEEAYVIDVIDDGAGFDPEAVEPTSDRHVGLENVRSRVARLCRGRISVVSTLDVGTRVTIEIPYKKEGRR